MAEESTVEELQDEARELDIEGRSSMNKEELEKEVAKAKKATAKKTAKKTTRKRTRRSTTSEDATLEDAKRDDAKKRLKEARKQGAGFGLDSQDPLLGWDAQQGRVRPVEED